MAFDVLTDLKDYLKITSADHDDRLGLYITNVSNQMENYCGQPLIERTVKIQDIIVSRDDRYLILLPYFLPTTIDSVYYKRFKLGEELEEISSDYYELFLTNNVYYLYLKLANGNTWDKSNYIYDVYCNVGYASDEVPEELNQVCVEMAATIYKESVQGSNLLNIASLGENFGGASSTTAYRDNVKRWQNILNNYRVEPI